jgi:hypothetical protein
MAWIAPRISYFLVGGRSYSAWSGGALSGMGCMVPQPFATRGNRSYAECWAVTYGQNRNSFVIAVTSMEFGSEIVGLRPP